MGYFKVQAKCGHVGRNKYILKWFYIKADSRKDAASIVRLKPRVKHDQKDAIRQSKEIEYSEYINGIKMMQEDNYFKIHNSSEQKIYNAIKQDEIYPEIKKIKYKRKRNGQRLKYLVKERECKSIIEKGIYV